MSRIQNYRTPERCGESLVQMHFLCYPLSFKINSIVKM
uniref:Uncharacterized protein n=1 Tax=uncultured bacterium BLR12 TaxID=506514 RepID=C0ING5_9BACT|nr:hypothetical protein AKSOIL_0236 [uncultured bacterium BLR12]